MQHRIKRTSRRLPRAPCCLWHIDGSCRHRRRRDEREPADPLDPEPESPPAPRADGHPGRVSVRSSVEFYLARALGWGVVCRVVVPGQDRGWGSGWEGGNGGGWVSARGDGG